MSMTFAACATRLTQLFLALLVVFSWSGNLAHAATCQFPGEPAEPSTITLQQVGSGFSRPVGIMFVPGYTDRYYVLEQYGLLKLVINNQVQATPALDLRAAINANGNETGFLGLAFHPQFVSNRRVFVNYTTNSTLMTRISEFSVDANLRVLPNTEKVLLTIPQPYSNHNGGNIAFGPDGYLYIGMGDGGSAGDPQANGQNLQSLLAKMLRIDVDRGSPYGIPADNPTFPSDPQAKREIFAYGLRNPWRFSFDRVTGELWAGDVGQDAYEEIDIVKKGENYGWRSMEGNHCYRPSTNCVTTGMTMPVIEYPHSEGASVTGGYVYRGRALPEFVGAYFYADYVSGNLWAARYDGTRVTSTKKLIANGASISSFGEDHDGELYALDHENGVVFKIVRARTTPNPAEFPRTVSATGCFASLSPLQPAAGVTPYNVQAPLWSDGAAKDRWIYVPRGTAPGVQFSATNAWSFPENTVLIKNFLVPQRQTSGTTANKLVETRFLIKRGQDFKGYSYRWNEAGTDAELLSGALSVPMAAIFSGHDEQLDYYFPSSSDCQRCHNSSTAGALGFDLLHLNYVHTGNEGNEENEGQGQNQILSLAARGVFTAASAPRTEAELSRLPRLIDPANTAEPLELRARSYLHSQCAYCHNPSNTAQQGELDLRYNTSLARMKICDIAPTQGDLGNPQSRILKPGDPEASLLWMRMASTEHDRRMPPLATGRVDELGSQLIKSWIRSVQTCPN